MTHNGYYDWASVPTTDEDTAIIRSLAGRIGCAYYGIHQTEQAIADRRDWMLAKVLQNSDYRIQAWSGRRQSIAATHADACYPFTLKA